MVCYWGLLDVWATFDGTTGTINVTTSKQCYLFLRRGYNEPDLHLVSYPEKGTDFLHGAYYCFTAYEDIEQNEEAPNWDHTFTVENWPIGQNICFYLWGYINGELCKSVTAPICFTNPIPSGPPPLIPACYNDLLTGISVITSGTDLRVARHFIPTFTYTCQKFSIDIKWPNIYYTFPSAIDFWLFRAFPSGSPSSIELAHVQVPSPTMYYNEFVTFDFEFDPVVLDAGADFNYCVGAPADYNSRHYWALSKGSFGACDYPDIHHAYISYYNGVVWSAWSVFSHNPYHFTSWQPE